MTEECQYQIKLNCNHTLYTNDIIECIKTILSNDY
jgi:hypothetical protein